MPDSLELKRCPVCKELKDITDFYVRRVGSGGHASECKLCSHNRRKAWAEQLKREILTHYGRGLLACVYCKFDDVRALSLDHTDGRGTEERRRLGKHGHGFYVWLRNKGYPAGYQTLCCNCQQIKRFERGEW